MSQATLKTYRRLLERMLNDSGLMEHGAACSAALDVLSEGFDPAWLEKNQKFDFSLSFPGDGLRFSISDFGEKEGFGRKLGRVFDLLGRGERYDRDALDALLQASHPTAALHQTTFGLDWPAGARRPRLKIYLEELRHHYPKEARRSLLGRAARSVGLKSPNLPPEEDLAALCVDFLPGGEKKLKTYAYRPARETPTCDPFRSFVGALSRESNAFYYLTLRHDGAGHAESAKLYKVYEVRRIRSLTEGFREMYDCLALLGSPSDVRRVESYRKAAKAEGGSLYPVLFAMDVKKSGQRRLDAYFSIR